MKGRWLTIVGLGEDGMDGLARAARDAIDSADLLVGSQRLLDLVPGHTAHRLAWPRPFSPMIAELTAYRGKSVVILATGDPLNYGIGRKLLEHFPVGEMRILPYPSAFSLAAARMGWSLPDVQTFTVHGRDDSVIEAYIQPRARLLALTEGDASVRAIASRLVARGFADSAMTVLEHMGGENEARFDFTAATVPASGFSDLLTLAIECIAGPDACILAAVPGLPDAAFRHDGQLTKREVRAVTVAGLYPFPHALLWDVGAGCGSVAIEWMRAAPHARAIAFERNPERLEMIEHNRLALGTPLLESVAGDVPGTLEGQPRPDAVFIGGDVGNPEIFNACWASLRPGGRLVSNAVTLEGESHLIALQARHGGDLTRIGVEYLVNVGTKRAMKPRMTVTQWQVTRP